MDTVNELLTSLRNENQALCSEISKVKTININLLEEKLKLDSLRINLEGQLKQIENQNFQITQN